LLDAGVAFTQIAEWSEGKHVLLLSGQLNLTRSRPRKSFTPGNDKAWGAANVAVCFEVKRGQAVAVSKCFKNGNESKKESKEAANREAGQRYDALADKTNKATSGSRIQLPCFDFLQSIF